jgi:hypothetical protein
VYDYRKPYIFKLRPFEGFAEIPIGLLVVSQDAMTDSNVIICNKGIIVVGHLAMLHVKFDALDDLLLFEVYNSNLVKGQGCTEKVL